MYKTLLSFLILLLSGITIFSQTTFTGTGNWSNAENWSAGVPTSTTVAYISSGATVTVNDDYACTDLTINSEAVVSISPGYTLTVSGTLTNGAGISGLILNSNASGTAMLMNNTAGVEATVKQYLKKNKWHFMGIPLTYVKDVNTVFNNCYVAWIDESNAYSGLESGWQYLNTGDDLHKMSGYIVQYHYGSLYNDTTITFTGTLNTGTIDTVFSSETEGWNFVSNPYPVTIDWDNPNITKFRTYDAIYVWHPDISNYGTYGSYISGTSTNGQTRYIPPMQGFFVEVWHVQAGLTLTNECKVSNIQAFRKNNIVTDTQIRLAVTDNDINFDEIVLRVKDGSTMNFDPKYDAGKLKAMKSRCPLLYSVIDNKEYSINSIPEINENLTIPLKVIIKTSGEHKLVLKELKYYNYSYPIVLFDENGKELTDLDNKGYTFLGEAGKIKSFYLGFKHNQ